MAGEKRRSALAGNGGTEVELDWACNGMRASGLRLAARWKSRQGNTSGNCVEMAGPTRRERRRSATPRFPTGRRSFVVPGTAMPASQHDRAGRRRGTQKPLNPEAHQ
jgi:hypothetical protein